MRSQTICLLPTTRLLPSFQTTPMAAAHGNFHDYYRFHGVAERMDHLPESALRGMVAPGSTPLLLCDLGCNEGDLTFVLASALAAATGRPVHALGVDLDDALIDRAIKKYCGDGMRRGDGPLPCPGAGASPSTTGPSTAEHPPVHCTFVAADVTQARFVVNMAERIIC